MKSESAKKNNFADVLAMDIRYAVLTKKARIQILVKPTTKELRKRGKKGWHLFATVDSQRDSSELVFDAFERALAEIEMGSATPNGNGKKSRAMAAPVV